jgi:AcrR family transcriptional regulator
VTEPKTRRRGAELEQAILDAAWAELTDVGYAALTIEGVAARAGTSKPVIYRRWPGRAELVLAAWARQRPQITPATDMGDLRSDLIALFNRIARRMNGMMSETIAGVMGEAFRHPEIADALRERLRSAPLGNWVQGIVDRAAERGELAPVTLSIRAARVPLDLVRNEAMMLGAPVSEETLVELVDQVYLPLLRGLGS